MRIAILADPGREAKDRPVIEEAKEAFGEANVTYAPITQVRFDISKTDKAERGMAVRINGSNLAEFDCIIPIPTVTYSELFYTALLMLENQTPIMPIDAKRYLLIMNEELLSNLLESNGIPVRKSVTVTSNASLDKVEENISYPAIVRPPKKHVTVTNRETLKDVISLYKIGTPIKIETPIMAEKDVWFFVMGEEVIASYERMKSGKSGESGKLDAAESDAAESGKFDKASKYFAPGAELKALALQVRRIVGCEYCAIRFLMESGRWIFDRLTLSPDFPNFKKITGVDIARYIVSGCAEKAKSRPWWYSRIEEILGIKK